MSEDLLILKEKDRLDHVGKAIQAALVKAGVSVDIPLEEVARAAIQATERYPAEGWPFDHNLNSKPKRLHPSTLQAFQEIDAAVFSGSMLFHAEQHIYLAAHTQRWSRAATEHRLHLINDLENETKPEPDL